jgi:hypothetical protein
LSAIKGSSRARNASRIGPRLVPLAERNLMKIMNEVSFLGAHDDDGRPGRPVPILRREPLVVEAYCDVSSKRRKIALFPPFPRLGAEIRKPTLPDRSSDAMH